MIEQLFIVIIALIFLLIGYKLGQSGINMSTEHVQSAPKNSKRNILARAAVKAGIIEYPTQEQVDYVESGEELVDKERERVFREQFKV